MSILLIRSTLLIAFKPHHGSYRIEKFIIVVSSYIHVRDFGVVRSSQKMV
ncbi:hypothetical protein HanIR_Chr03g0106091 [Helianthus annuus]|nr:hypothetical protein HanIR_Chr03g0106091 [Helianthus annuus]